MPGKKIQSELLECTTTKLTEMLERSMRMLATCEAAKAYDAEAKKKTQELKSMQEDMANLMDAGKKVMKKVKGWLEGIGITSV